MLVELGKRPTPTSPTGPFGKRECMVRQGAGPKQVLGLLAMVFMKGDTHRECNIISSTSITDDGQDCEQFPAVSPVRC